MMSHNPSEVCLIDANVTSISKLNLRPSVISLNLHCNSLKSIEGLGNLRNLKHLDLSSNAIEAITGLEGLNFLKYLNLSCNRITVVEGLESLRFVYINILNNLQSCRYGWSGFKWTIFLCIFYMLALPTFKGHSI